eukprot:4989166-Heterocapsa_arctica.AAC.1
MPPPDFRDDLQLEARTLLPRLLVSTVKGTGTHLVQRAARQTSKRSNAAVCPKMRDSLLSIAEHRRPR